MSEPLRRVVGKPLCFLVISAAPKGSESASFCDETVLEKCAFSMCSVGLETN